MQGTRPYYEEAAKVGVLAVLVFPRVSAGQDTRTAGHNPV